MMCVSSGQNTMACVTCHRLGQGGDDGLPRAIMANGTRPCACRVDQNQIILTKHLGDGSSLQLIRTDDHYTPARDRSRLEG